MKILPDETRTVRLASINGERPLYMARRVSTGQGERLGNKLANYFAAAASEADFWPGLCALVLLMPVAVIAVAAIGG